MLFRVRIFLVFRFCFKPDTCHFSLAIRFDLTIKSAKIHASWAAS